MVSQLETARGLIRRGRCIIPIPHGSKAPAINGWSALRINDDDVEQHFADPCNIGLLLGEPSQWIVDIDLDVDEAARAAPWFFPSTYSYGRNSRPGSHLLVTCNGATTRKYTFEHKVLLEVRSTGAQSLIPPSQHPSGELYRVDNGRAGIATIGTAALYQAAGRTAAAALFAMHWDGGRHAKALALAGALAHAGWSDDDTVEFVECIAQAALDDECEDRSRAAQDSVQRHRDGNNTTGWPSLAEHFGEAVIAQARKWLDIQDGPKLNGTAHPDPETWPEPQPIVADLLAVEPLLTAIIPEPYRAWIVDVSERMQTPPDFLATAAIVVTATVIGTACTIKPKCRDDWQVVPNLWGGAIGRPSVLLKSPAMKEALNPLARLEVDAKKVFDEAQLGHAADLEMHKAEREVFKDMMKKAAKSKDADDIANLKDRLSTLTSPDAPIWRRYKTNDATIERCNELMRDNPRGLLLFRDELTGLLSGWEKPGRESDRAYFLEGWNGNHGHTDDRIGRGTTYAENVCISLYGGIQPSKLETYLYQCMHGLENDGLMQRLQLAVYPDEPKRWELIDRYPETKAKNRAYSVIQTLASADFGEYSTVVDGDDTFRYLRFADDAQELFYQWLTDLQGKLGGEGEPVVLEHLGKYRSLMPSLALIFHLIDVADDRTRAGSVSLRAAELAAAWCDYLESHARRIYGLVTNANQAAAAMLLQKIDTNKLSDGFTVRDVYRQNWRLLNDRTQAQNACDDLVAAGWLREQVTPPEFRQKEKIAYLINPKARQER